MTKRIPRYSPEVRARSVRMVFEHQHEHASQWATIASIAAKIGCTAETLRDWVRQAERNEGKRAGLTTDERDRATLEWVDWFMYGCPRSRKGVLTAPACDRVRSCIRPRVAAMVMPRAGMEMREPSANQHTRA